MKTMLAKIQLLDERLIRHSKRLHVSEALTKFLLMITYSGYGWGWLTLVALMNVLKYTGYQLFPQQLLFHECLFAALIAWATGYLIKKMVNRKRPFEAIADHEAKYSSRREMDRSFPSNHTAAAIAFFLALTIKAHPLAPIVGVWALLVTFSRYYLGVHYPSDILVGVLLGIGSAVAALPFITAI